MQSAPQLTPITVTRTFDTALIRGVLEQLLDTLAEDVTTVPPIDCVSDCWLNIDGMGVFHLHADNSTTLYIHAQVLKQYRYRSVQIGHAVWDWVLNECPENYQKIIALIPVIYPNVKSYAEKMGMRLEGVNRLSACKDGKIVDQWLMGITRQEMEDFMHV